MGSVGRIVAIAAVVVVVIAAAVIFFSGVGTSYSVNAKFINSSQLVRGNTVQIAGVQAGQVTDIQLTPDGQAIVHMSINSAFAPLRRGTKARVKQTSLSGIANRYVELELPGGKGDPIENGGTITIEDTTSAVEIDQLFNTLDANTRESLQSFIKGSARQFQGRAPAARQGFKYLNPALSTSSRVFNEINRDTPTLRRFLGDSAQLVTAL